MEEIDRITRDVVDAAFRSHRDPGPGLPKNFGEAVIAGRLLSLGSGSSSMDRLRRRFPHRFPISKREPVEVRSGEHLASVHVSQLPIYLHLTRHRLGAAASAPLREQNKG
ncbi:hypothetical protein COC42_00825 [Sphingomonas spermidinifaciens]|uniref:Uncharacterized protein n=1 Tax=Sphingomonas spermidinifaciens TaxID=1141889 RepID=A0A2A4B3J3_9SPHN|nr:hypothetical protein [Sphingomonas spermidinifaciens]PCD03011.1 hypothetical protein COC42_00825 [Sphingomonas spermidinifaciens]